MRRILLATLILHLAAAVSLALPAIPKHIKEDLADKEEYQAYVKDVSAATDKCASCHIPKMDKKAKGHALNDFGQAMHKHLDDKGFQAAEKAKNVEKAKELFLEAWDKAVEEKNADGQQFGEIIKAGKLPGKND